MVEFCVKCVVMWKCAREVPIYYGVIGKLRDGKYCPGVPLRKYPRNPGGGKIFFFCSFFFFFFLLLSVSVTVVWSSRRWSVRDYKRVVASNFYAKGLACSAFTWGLGIRRRGAETDGLIAWKMG